MDTAKLCAAISAEPGGTFWFNDIHLHQWGQEIVLNGLYDPPIAVESPVTFRIVLRDCRDIEWRVYAHLRPPEDKTLPVATLVNVRLGSNGHRKPLHLLTDFFGLKISYGEMLITRGDEQPDQP
jgi:hypothetical protein